MLSENCSFHRCSNSRKNPTVSFFKIPRVKSSDSEFTKQKKLPARAEWVRILTKTRVLDADLQRQLNGNSIHVCKIHFKEEDTLLEVYF